MANKAGMPSWVDLGTSDLKAATEFYCDLFGWTPHISPEPEARGYTIFNLNGKPAAGAGPVMMEQQPTAWSMYVATNDVDATTRKVEQAGGKVLVPPLDVMEFGRMAVCLDQAGAAFSAWQAGTMGGAEVYNEDNAFSWAELITRDPQGSKEFYGKVFGWTANDQPTSGPMGESVYTMFSKDGQPGAGMLPMEGDMWPADLPNYWMNYFNVDDCDAMTARVRELGGSVSVEPTDIRPGRFAVVADPQGANFSIIKVDPNFVMS